jgi:hypothetical protein
MSDDVDTGAIVAGEVAPGPSEFPKVVHVDDEKSREQIVKEQFDLGLGLAAHGTEDATDYIRERETQDRHLAGEDLSGAQMREWHERAHSSLQRAVDAAARARGEIIPPSKQQMSEENIPGYISPDDPQYEAHIEANKARFSDYFDNPENIGSSLTAAEHKKSVMDWILTYDPRSNLVGHFMASPLGPQMMEALEGEGEAIRYLANLPPQQRAREMAKLEGYVHAQQALKQQNAAYEPQPRRHTQAPPPIRPPRGGANPPANLHGLASRAEDVSDYVRMRQQQERRRDD